MPAARRLVEEQGQVEAPVQALTTGVGVAAGDGDLAAARDE